MDKEGGLWLKNVKSVQNRDIGLAASLLKYDKAKAF